MMPTIYQLKPASGEFADLLMLPLNSYIETSEQGDRIEIFIVTKS